MPARKPLELVFPAGGLNRAAPYQYQPPFTSPSMMNVAPRDTIEGRVRGGSRPMLVKAFSALLGSGNPIRMMAGLRSLNSSGTAVFVDDFTTGVLDPAWEAFAASNGGTATVNSGVGNGVATSITEGLFYGNIHTTLSPSQTAPQRITIKRTSAITHTRQYFLWLLRADAGVSSLGIRLQILTGLGDVNLHLEVDGVIVASAVGLPGGDHIGILEIDGNNTIRCWANTNSTTPHLVYELGTYSRPGTRFGFELIHFTASQPATIDWFRYDYTSSAGGFPPEALVASSNGLVYREASNMTMIAIGSMANMDLASDRQIQARDYRQKLYIADYGLRREVATKVSTVTISSLGVLTDTAVTDFSDQYGVDQDGDVIEITSLTGAGGAVIGAYPISAEAGSTVTLTGWTGTTTETAYRIVRGMKIYDSKTDTLSRWTATTGKLPVACPLIEVFLDCIVLAGDPNDPQEWYILRQGNPLDADYSQFDSRGATYGSNTESGRIAEPVTCLASHERAIMLFGCLRSLWMLTGHPRQGGRIEQLSRVIGMPYPAGWCAGPEGHTYFLTFEGLYVINPGERTPRPLSVDLLPQELRNLSPDMYDVSLTYSVNRRAVEIFVTPKVIGQTTHYIFDIPTLAFEPQSYSSIHEPTAIALVSDTPLYGCRDGYVRKHSDAATTDDGVEVTSRVMLGPFRYDAGRRRALVNALDARLADDSAVVSWNLRTGETAKEAIESAVAMTGEWSGGLNDTDRPRLSDPNWTIELEATGKWAMESLLAEVLDGGPT